MVQKGNLAIHFVGWQNSFSKIQFVAKVSKKCLVLVLLLFLTIEALVVIDGGLRSGF